MLSSVANVGELRLYVSPVLAPCPSPGPVRITGQVSASPLLSLPLNLSVRHLDLGMKGRRDEESARSALNSSRIFVRNMISSFNETMDPSFEPYIIFPSFPSVSSLNMKPPC